MFCIFCCFFFFFFKQKTAYEMLRSLVGSEMCIRDRSTGVSGTISPPYSGYFSPFPHGTGSLSVSQEYLALPDGAGGFRRDFSGPALLRILLGNKTLLIQDSHLLRLAFPRHSNSFL
eukprot:TRINITY_DN13723_c0_g1_i1.p1 TRINITY_DN13723_c0_g1~~TRINITY_DN13723_c0_g1_i1.p1  ORF type:complete len:117 (+),score=16.99 TRINITY_DN13723_c0_g1_i1:57-407(+)